MALDPRDVVAVGLDRGDAVPAAEHLDVHDGRVVGRGAAGVDLLGVAEEERPRVGDGRGGALLLLVPDDEALHQAVLRDRDERVLAVEVRVGALRVRRAADGAPPAGRDEHRAVSVPAAS